MSRPNWLRYLSLAFAVTALSLSAEGQTCLSTDDMDVPTRTALTGTAKRYFDAAAQGDVSTLRQNSIASVASDFSGIETAVKDNQANLAGAQAAPRPPFLLKVEGNKPIERAEFLCGVFGSRGQTANSAVFVLNNLPVGNYGIVTVDAAASKGAHTVSFILQQQGTDWKLGGFYVKSSQIGGHDGNWFADRAREFKAKGQTRNAWFYFQEARDLLSPVPFMSTLATDKLYDEAQAAKPSDLPIDGPIDLVVQETAPQEYVVEHTQPQKQTQQFSVAKVKTYKMTAMFPLAVGNDFDVVVKYQSADVSNTGQTFQDNSAVIKALVIKFPEFRGAFDGVVARAVEPSGRDYGSLLTMKDIK